MFLIEKGQFVVIRDNTGTEVVFGSLADLNKYTGVDLSGKWYVGYEPDNNFFMDSEDDAVDPSMIPYAPYEDLISEIALFKSRVDDPYYGMTPGEQAIAELAQQRLDDIATARTQSGLKDITPEAATTYIETQLDTTDLDATVGPLRAASDLASAKAAVEDSLVEMRKLVIAQREVLLKMVPYLLG